MSAEAGDNRPPWPVFKAALEAEDFRPSRRYGQNFLLDENTARAIVADARLDPGDSVLEVGTGCGFLTVHLARAVAKLWTVEVDPRLARVASPFLDPFEHVELIEGDVLATKNRLSADVEARLADVERWHLVSNLPYSVSGPVLALVAGHVPRPQSMTVLVQKEVAERLAARPGTKAWGPLSLAVQLAFEPRIVRSVGPASFWPRPRVDSSVVHCAARAEAPSPEAAGAVVALARRVFERRRQSLGRVLGDVLGGRERADVVLARAGVDGGGRAEGLSVEEWLRLGAGV